MIETIKNAFTTPDIRRKILLTMALLLVYRIGCFVPIPGLDVSIIQNATSSGSYDLMQMLSMITGGSLSQGTLFALGIVPFINSFIIMQLLTLIIPKLEKLSKEGEDGKKKINQYTRYLAILLGIVQGIGIMISWKNSGAIAPVFGDNTTSSVFTMIFIVIILTAGSSLVMWLGERITEHGIGNGTSLIIFIGILSTLGTSIGTAIFSTIPERVKGGVTTDIWFLLAFFVLVIALFILIVFVDMAERRISVQYAKQIKGNKMYGGQSTYIPIKVNSGGVMPIIFASSLIMFPQMIFQFIPSTNEGWIKFVTGWSTWIGVGSHHLSSIYVLANYFLRLFLRSDSI